MIKPVAVHGDLLISNPLVLLTCAIDGMGPALLANWLAGDALADGNLVDLFPDYTAAAPISIRRRGCFIQAAPTYRPRSGS